MILAVLVALLSGASDAREPLPAEADGAPPEPPAPRPVYRLDLAVDLSIVAVGAGAGVARLFFKDQLARISCPCSAAGLNFIDRGSVSASYSDAANLISDVSVALALGLPPLLDLFDLGFSEAWAGDFVVFVDALAVNFTAQQVANFGFARPRPKVYANDPGYLHSSDGYLSFYSGHVAMAVAGLSAAAYTLRLRYGEQVWPWIVTGAVGTSIAVERVLGGSHFPTDVAAGFLAGAIFGIGVPWLHARAREHALSVLPTEGGRGLLLAGAF